MDRAALLHQVPVFGSLQPRTLEFLLARATRIVAAAGAEIVREGEPGGDLYIIETGSADVFKRRPGSRAEDRILLASLKAGDCFGETSLLGIMPRSASVVAS